MHALSLITRYSGIERDDFNSLPMQRDILILKGPIKEFLVFTVIILVIAVVVVKTSKCNSFNVALICFTVTTTI
jgi:hypothetical protein